MDINGHIIRTQLAAVRLLEAAGRRSEERRFDRASLVWPIPGKNRRRSVERREAQAPTSLGLRIPGGGPDGTPVVRGQVPSQRTCQGSLASSHGVSQTPGASRRSITSLRRGRGKRGRAYPAPENKEYGQRSVGYHANIDSRWDRPRRCAPLSIDAWEGK